jgi:1,2-diacylglycerol 3-alpha-glucosyltransferase
VPSLSSALPIPIRRPVRVYFPCTGLGRQLRGFETFTLECASALRDDSRVSLTVFSGAPVSGCETRVLWNLPRSSRLAAFVGRCIRRDAYVVEQLTFFLSLLPSLVFGRPDLVYFADLNLGNLCWHWRRLTRQRYALLYYNGGTTTRPFTRADFVQQVTPAGLASALERGESADRQAVLPHGMRVPATLPVRLTGSARTPLGLPADRPVVLSVGVLDATYKRMDYLIREVAALPTPRPFLCLLGADGPESDAIRALARELLGHDVLVRAVPHESIGDYYSAADVFALASLQEGFGLAYVEALMHGLPIVASDTPVTRHLLGDLAILRDLSVAGEGTRAIAWALASPLTERERLARHASARARFDWASLREPYVEMLLQTARRAA